MATTQQDTGHFSGLVAIIASAAAASVAVFTLFSSFLESLVPPYQDSKTAVGFATFGTAIALLALSLVMQRKLSTTSARLVSLVCVVLLFISVSLFGYYQDFTRTYVYRFPPASLASESQTRHVRGELHENGRSYVGDKAIAQAVFELGGPDYVNSKGLLWNEASSLKAVSRMEMLYIILAMLLTTTLFTAGLAVWRVAKP